MEHLGLEDALQLLAAWVVLVGGALSYAFWRILRAEKALGPLDDAEFEEEHQP